MKKRTAGILTALVLVAVAAMGQIYVEQQPGGKARMKDYSYTPGTLIWVCSSTGTDGSGYGLDPSTPVATVDYAISNLTTADKGDRIEVCPGHVEDGATTTIFDADVAGITIEGQGNGLDRPEFHYNNAADVIAIGADNVTLKNLVFVPSVTTITKAIDVETNVDHFTIENCEFAVGEAAGTDEFVTAITLNSGASDAVIKNNKFFTAITDANCAQAVNLGVGGAVARVEISDNLFYGNYSTAAIIDGTTAVTELLIRDNYIKVKDGEPGIELAAATTGLISNNQIESTGITATTAVVAADCSWFNNWVVTGDGLASVPLGLSSTEATIAATQALHGASLDDIETKIDNLSGNTAVGSEFMISKALVHTSIVTGGTVLTGAASGTLQLVDVVVLNGATIMDASGGASDVSLYTDNAQGSANIALTSDDDFSAARTITLDKFDTVSSSGTVLLNGKKVKIKTSANDETTDGNMTVYMIFRRLSSGATIAAAP